MSKNVRKQFVDRGLADAQKQAHQEIVDIETSLKGRQATANVDGVMVTLDGTGKMIRICFNYEVLIPGLSEDMQKRLEADILQASQDAYAGSVVIRDKEYSKSLAAKFGEVMK